MDYDKYENTLPYPVKSNFQTKYWYHRGKVVAVRPPGSEIQMLHELYTPNMIADLTVTETIVDTEAFRAAKDVYAAVEARRMENFKADLFEELGITDHPKRELLYSKAWEHGHASGLQDVFNWAEDLVDLIKD